MDLGATFEEFQRELTVENVRAEFTAANRTGCRGGRPRSMEEGKISDVIKQLTFEKAAFYRYFLPERIRTLRR